MPTAQRDPDRISQQAVQHLIENSKVGFFRVNEREPVSDDDPPVFVIQAKLPDRWEVVAGSSKREASLRLVEAIYDGTECPNCGRASAVETEYVDGTPMALFAHLCWMYYSTDTDSFTRTCGGPI